MLMVGLVLSQLLPKFLDAGSYEELRHMVEVTLGICLAFIMINAKQMPSVTSTICFNSP